MQFIIFTTFVCFSCAVLVTLGENHHVRPSYDIVQSLKDLGENIRTEQSFIDFEKEFKDTKFAWISNFKKISWLINNLANRSNDRCVQDLLYTAKSIKFINITEQWGLKMLDSFGKPESGFLSGNVKWLGEFNECRNVYAPLMPNSTTVGRFHGKYCSLQITMSVLPIPLTLGICLPETCNPSDFMNGNESIISPLLSKGKVSPIQVTSFTCKANTRQLSNAAIATICVLSIYFLLAFLGSSVTAVQYFASLNSPKEIPVSISECKSMKQTAAHEQMSINSESRMKSNVFVEESKSFLNCFCIFTNGSKLLNTDSTEGQLLCLNGIRFLSMSWVILCHTYMFIVTILKSMKNLKDKVENLPFQVVLNGWYSVDSFFLLSGFLMAYLYFQECAKRNGRMPWLYFYVHRYLRLTPVCMIALAFYATIFPYLGSGPFWPDYDVDPNCQKSWWWNLLYINNFKNSADMCFGWGWYLANDMQFFAISPLFLITLWKWPKIGYSLLASFLLVSWIVSFVLTYHYNLIAGTLSDVVTQMTKDPTFMSKWDDYFNKIYTKPYTRIAPYILGIALGYLMFRRKINNFPVNNITLWIGWLLAIPIGLTCIYGVYDRSPYRVAASFFNALIRTVYSLCLSWVIFVCLIGKGGPVDKILSFKLFIPLSRLTYCAYLIHLIVISTYFSSLKLPLDFSHFSMVLLFLGLISTTYALALLVSLVFESPIIRLEKYVRGKF